MAHLSAATYVYRSNLMKFDQTKRLIKIFIVLILYLAIKLLKSIDEVI